MRVFICLGKYKNNMSGIAEIPDEVTLKKIRDVSHEDPKRTENNVKLIVEWMNCEQHMPRNYDPRILVNFVRDCKNDLPKTKIKLENFYVLKAKLPNIFQVDIESESFLRFRKYLSYMIYPRLTSKYERLHIGRLNEHDPALFNLEYILQLICVGGELKLLYEMPRAGDVFIFDAELFTAKLIPKLLNSNLRVLIHLLEDVYPLRIKGIHMINVNKSMVKFMEFFKPLLKEKLRSKIFLHTSSEALKEYFSQDDLPSNYGGKRKSVEEMDSVFDEILRTHWTLVQEQLAVRCSGPIPEKYDTTFEDIFGIAGSFRKLDID